MNAEKPSLQNTFIGQNGQQPTGHSEQPRALELKAGLQRGWVKPSPTQGDEFVFVSSVSSYCSNMVVA